MKKADTETMRKRYDFSGGVRGKYARRCRGGIKSVVIESDGVASGSFSKGARRGDVSPKAKGIGSTVKALRAQSGLTTTRLAKKVGISQAQISRLENGRQGFRSVTLVRIAKALKIPPFRLFMTDKEWAKWQRAKDGTRVG